MSAPVCPYLGTKEDPNTTLGFPSDGNCCHHASPVMAVKREHQQSYCLTPGHVNCPVFQRANLAPLPNALRSPIQGQPQRSRGMLAVFIVAFALLGMFGVKSLWDGYRVVGGAPVGTPSVPPASSSTASGSIMAFPEPGAATYTQTLTPTLFLPQVALPEATSVQACSPAAGWLEYAVKPADSTFRLSVIYRVTVEDLLRGNCMDQGMVLRPGQTILVPPPPTQPPTASPTNTPTSTSIPEFSNPPAQPPFPYDPVEPPSDDPDPTEQPTSTTAPPTATQVRPTNTQVWPTSPPFNTPTAPPLPTERPVDTPVLPPTDVPPPTSPPPTDLPPPPTDVPVETPTSPPLP